MYRTLVNLAEIHYELGLIDYDEFNERVGIALWLSDGLDVDPRDGSEGITESNNLDGSEREKNQDSVIAKIDSGKSNVENDESWLEFLCLGVWVFTKSDQDPYPSIPHGHFKSQNKKWPKLNPYTGRVFKSKHQEDKSQRLEKKEMRDVWTDEKFKSFCREMIIWYREQFPYHEFSVSRPLRMPRW